MAGLGGLLLAGLAIPMVLVLLGGLVVLVVAGTSAGRAEADPSGERARAVFLGITTWLAEFIALFATFAIVVAVAGYIGSGGSQRLSVGYQVQQGIQSGTISRGSVTYGPGSSAVLQAMPSSAPAHGVSTALGAGLIALAAGVVLLLYGRRLWGLISGAEGRGGPEGSAVRIYLLATVFTSIFIAVFAGASALFSIYRTVAPGVAGLGSGHGPGLRELVDSVYLAAGALVIFRFHHPKAFPRTPRSPDGDNDGFISPGD